jgi:class 3 adenylate cyclase
MCAKKWQEDVATQRIEDRLAEVEQVVIKDYVRDTDLNGLPRNHAYRVDGVHVYVDILNIDEMLGVTGEEGVTCHRRTLRFLNQHYRAVSRILSDVDAIHVDFHNQRLHAVVVKPYGDEQLRIHRAIALSQLIIDVLKKTGEDSDDPLPAAVVRVGIDSGIALAVNNGRRGHREPLFLGCPANLAAKRAGGGMAAGIFMTNTARATLGLATVTNEDGKSLTALEISASQNAAQLEPTVDSVLKAWREDLTANPIGKFEFSAHTPPFTDLDIELLTPKNSRRQEAASIYADIDGFTAYVAAHIDDDEQAKDVVRVLHVLRSELDAVLAGDFAGVKIRFIGDCVHGAIVEGSAAATDVEQTITTIMRCAGALRSSFELALDILAGEGFDCSLGLAIGIEYGPVALTRLGIKGEMIRCCISRGVLASEDAQLSCTGTQTAIGLVVQAKAPQWLTDWFGKERRHAGVTYDAVEAAIARAKKQAEDTKKAASLLRPAAVVPGTAADYAFANKPSGPVKPAGFA